MNHVTVHVMVRPDQQFGANDARPRRRRGPAILYLPHTNYSPFREGPDHLQLELMNDEWSLRQLGLLAMIGGFIHCRPRWRAYVADTGDKGSPWLQRLGD